MSFSRIHKHQHITHDFFNTTVIQFFSFFLHFCQLPPPNILASHPPPAPMHSLSSQLNSYHCIFFIQAQVILGRDNLSPLALPKQGIILLFSAFYSCHSTILNGNSFNPMLISFLFGFIWFISFYLMSV